MFFVKYVKSLVKIWQRKSIEIARQSEMDIVKLKQGLRVEQETDYEI